MKATGYILSVHREHSEMKTEACQLLFGAKYASAAQFLFTEFSYCVITKINILFAQKTPLKQQFSNILFWDFVMLLKIIQYSQRALPTWVVFIRIYHIRD